jgi:hypothetical protein
MPPGVAQRMTDDKAAATAVLASAKTTPRGTRFASDSHCPTDVVEAPFAAAEIVLIPTCNALAPPAWPDSTCRPSHAARRHRATSRQQHDPRGRGTTRQ